MMHIIYLTNEYPKKGLNGGGIGSVVQFLGRQLVSKGIRVSVIGMNNSFISEMDNDNGVQIYRLAKSTWRYAKFYDNTKRILRKIEELNLVEKIDIVEGSELSFAFFPSRTSYKKIIRLHGGHHFFAIELNKKPALWRGYQEKSSFKRADKFIAVSNYVGSQTQKYLKYNFEYSTIYNCVDTDKFDLADSAIIIENSLLFVGTVCEKKGVRQLVQAIPLIMKKVPNIQLKIVGRDWRFKNGNSYIEYLRGFITEDIEKNIEIVGPVPHNKVSGFIEKSDVCVFPSHMEAMPITWLEGLAMGKKVVASKIGPGLELVKDNETGLLVNPYSPEDIAQKIIQILSNPKEAERRAINAREDILKRFDSFKIVEKNIKFYKSIIKK
jgi:glycosyltransferase involved in cell wall biosynthesis